MSKQIINKVKSEITKDAENKNQTMGRHERNMYIYTRDKA